MINNLGQKKNFKNPVELVVKKQILNITEYEEKKEHLGDFNH